MLTGDNKEVAAAVGAGLGLDEVRAELGHGWAGHFHAGLTRIIHSFPETTASFMR
jgi:magnesium-transporting ATPase (P-type)